MNTLLPLALAAAVLATSAAAAEPARQCFRVSQMKGHTVADSKTLYVAVGHRDVYRMDMAGACLSGALHGDPLVIETSGGSDMICRPIDLNLKVADPIGATPCLVSQISRLTPEQAAALPRKLRP